MIKITLLISRLTSLELLQNNAFRVLLLGALILPLAAFILCNLFMQDIGKVFIDGIIGLHHLFAWAFILFFASPLLAKDVESKTCYLLLCPPVTRNQYLMGRFIGILGMFVLLFFVLAISSACITASLFDESYSGYMSGLTLLTIPSISFFQFVNYLSMIGALIFIFSWATGVAEIMLFTMSVLFLSWLFPPMLSALQRPDLAQHTPEWNQLLIKGVYQLFPHLNGANIATALAYGKELPLPQITAYCIEHITYTALCLILASILFRKRNL